MHLTQRLRHSDWFDRLPFDHYKRKSAKPVYLDVWLVDFFAEPDNVNNDAGCLFVLQENIWGLFSFQRLIHASEMHLNSMSRIEVCKENDLST